MKKICVVTATRAEYGLLKTLIRRLKKNNNYEIKIVVTGAHLSPEYGLTYKEIEEDGNNIDKKIEMLLSADTSSAISKSMGLALIGFADYFEENEIDALIILGDRYESLAVAIAAMNKRIPIIHLYGGETTEGAVDESIRHAITKLSYLHFTSTEEYRQRVIQLGENPSRVFNVGALGVENVKNEKLLTKKELEESLKIDLSKDYIVATFHPVTLENNSAERQMKELMEACIFFKDINFIFTKSNADSNSRIINKMIDEYSMKYKNIFAFTSLGMKRYLSAIKYACMVIGNSSSGLVEVPSFKIPTINIGDRQKGRIKADSIIDCIPQKEKIIDAIKLGMNNKERFKNIDNPYGNGDTSNKIVNILDVELFKDIELKKIFYDIKIGE